MKASKNDNRFKTNNQFCKKDIKNSGLYLDMANSASKYLV